ncbi:MAG: hypothetical protein LC689_11750, partial [Myxococcales bacterium]|nr:hypothetical protein [Myxococcales bacterium]
NNDAVYEFGTISTSGAIQDRFGSFSGVNALTFGHGSGFGISCYPNLPAPIIEFNGVTQGRYNIPVKNYSSFPDALFAFTDQYGPCGLSTVNARTWVDIYEDTNPPQIIYGFCGFRSAQDLATVWTPFPPDTNSVHIVLHDRACNVTYTSNSVVLPRP